MFEYLFGNSAAARQMIDRCVRDSPASAEMLKVKASIEGTADRLAPPGERRPIAFMHYQMGLYFLRLHQAAEAGEQLRRALRFDPALYRADFDLAVLDATGGRPREALHHCLLAEAHGGSGLTRANRISCMQLIRDSARTAGDPGLERAAGLCLDREAAAK
jgi:hypothetical protein